MGHIEDHKRIEDAITAIALASQRLPDIELEIYGQGSARDKLEAHAKKLGVAHRVTFMGFARDPISVLRGAAAMCFTSAGEGLPFVVSESIICECPVISYDIKYGPRDIIEEGKSGFLVRPGETEEFADRIIDVLSGAISRDDIAQQSRALADRLSPLVFQRNMVDLVMGS